MTIIKALETSYAGCRFRSRLEARWAVFFDRLGIRWEYEPQGFLIGSNDFAADPRPYLPDFRLPDLNLWVEVKGEAAALDVALMVNASIRHWGLPGGDLLILGAIPRTGGRPAHSVLRFHKGDIWREHLEFHTSGLVTRTQINYGEIVGNDSGDVFPPDPNLVDPIYFAGRCSPFVDDAYRAARSARFEHGERPC